MAACSSVGAGKQGPRSRKRGKGDTGGGNNSHLLKRGRHGHQVEAEHHPGRHQLHPAVHELAMQVPPGEGDRRGAQQCGRGGDDGLDRVDGVEHGRQHGRVEVLDPVGEERQQGRAGDERQGGGGVHVLLLFDFLAVLLVLRRGHELRKRRQGVRLHRHVPAAVLAVDLLRERVAHEEPHPLVPHNVRKLPLGQLRGQPGQQVARRASLQREVAHHVHRRHGAGAAADGREERRRKHRLEVGAAVVVEKRVVARQRSPPVEEPAQGQPAPANDDRGVGRASQLRPRLGHVPRPQPHVLKRSLGRLNLARQKELGAALQRVLGPRAVQNRAGAAEISLVRLGNQVQVIELDRVCGGVVPAAHEPSVDRDADAVPLLEGVADRPVVGRARKHLRAQPALVAAARVAAVRGREGVVHSAGAVASQHSQARKVGFPCSADVPEELREPAGHLLGAEGGRKVGARRRQHRIREGVFECNGGGRGDRFEQELPCSHRQQSSRDHDRAEGGEGRLLVGEGELGEQLLPVRVPAGALREHQPVFVHLHVEEARDTECLDVGRPVRQGLDVPAERLLALVEAGEELQVGPGLADRPGGQRRPRVERPEGDSLVLGLELSHLVEVLVGAG
eukprot:scaffold1144_cov101-Isochrysis_galbana.AAC.1